MKVAVATEHKKIFDGYTQALANCILSYNEVMRSIRLANIWDRPFACALIDCITIPLHSMPGTKTETWDEGHGQLKCFFHST